MKTRAFVVGGTQSGSGKTTITLALMAAFASRNHRVQGFKVGPDYIDPSLHRIITGKPSINLDSWMMPERFLKWSFSRAARDSEINIVEGVMGLYDSRTPVSDDGSTAEVSRILGLPVILVVNAASMARSAAAIVKGFMEFDRKTNVAGVIFNNVGSDNHLRLLTESVNKYCNIPVVGGFKREHQVALPSRHLGLFMGEDNVLTPEMIKKLSELATANLDLRLLRKISTVELPDSQEIDITPPFDPSTSSGQRPSTLRQAQDTALRPFGRLRAPQAQGTASSGQRLRQRRTQGGTGSGHRKLGAVLFEGKKKMAVAMDNAFCFYYHDNLEILKKWGFDLVFFSPLEDTRVPDNVDAIYFGGGYPELYAEELAKNDSMKESIRRFHEKNGWIYAECGGLMYLGKAIENQEGDRFPMCGIFPFTTRVLPRLKSLGYVEIEPREDFLFLTRQTPVRGHEFHYSEITRVPRGLKNIYLSSPRGKSSGYRIKNTLASYVHLHFAGLVAGK